MRVPERCLATTRRPSSAAAIAAVKAKIDTLQGSLPKGVEIVPVYDRSGLIERAVENLTHKLAEEFLVVAVVCFAFLFHLRSAFVAIVSLPLGILAAFIVMRYQGVNANIMSLGGIAIAIGAMVDAAVVMIENAHKHLEQWGHAHPGGRRELRDSLAKVKSLPIVTERGQRLLLSDVADIRITDGPPMLRSENARLSGWVYVDIRGRDLASAVHDMQGVVAQKVALPPGYSISWSGQFEFLERAAAKMKIVVPFTLLIIFVLLYLTFGSLGEAALIMATLPFALIGGIWLLWLLGYNLSVAGAVGFIALAGVSAEFGVIMLLYLKNAWNERVARGETGEDDLLGAIREGAVLRVRPKAMTVAVILGGLFPIMWGTGTGSEVMQRIAAPMVGGMITAPLLSMFVVPAAYLLMRRRQTRRGEAVENPAKASLDDMTPMAYPKAATATI